MEINKQRNRQFTTRFIFSLPLEKRFLYNGGKQTEMGSSVGVLYIMEFTMRFIFSLPLEKRFIYNGDKQTEKWAVHNEFIFSLPLEKRFIYNGDKQTEKWALRFIYIFHWGNVLYVLYIIGGKWAVHNEVYKSSHWRNVLYIMEVNKQRNGQFTMRFIYSVFHWRNVLYIMEINKQRNGQFTMRFIFSLPLEKRFTYNGGKQTENNEVYIQSSIGETFYIMEVNKQRNGQFTMRFIYYIGETF